MFSSTNDVQLLQSASEYAQRALRCSPNISLAYKVLGICARLQENYNLALSSLAKCLVFAPQDPECFRELAFLSIIAGKFDDASAYASDALLHDPINAKSHFTLALSQQMKHEYPDAENSYKQAQLFGEDEEDLTINYIQNVWLNEGQHNKVIDYFQKKFQSAPKDYRYCYWIGRAYQLSIQNSTAQKWLKEGLAIAQQTIELNPNDARALSFVGLFHSRLGNFSDGETAIKRAIQIDSTSPEILFRCAELYSIQSDTQNAFIALAHALQRTYDFAELLNPDFSFIAREPEFQPAVTRKIEDQWPMK
jgi:tetratricopeptide (TPR) repeat protein